MTNNIAVQEPFRLDVVGDMTIEWDVPIEVSDGAVLRADIFRPASPGRYPAIAAYGPYRKGLPFQELLPPSWRQMITAHPDVVEGSSGKYQVYEFPDPEKWVPDGYVCVRIDTRGTGRSPGYLDPFSEREDQDLYECIEWIAGREWSDGKVGLNGISYLAMNQWRVAAMRPPHLTAICVWEGWSDLYRDVAYHGGILSGFLDWWYHELLVQYGVGERGGRNPNTGQLACGDETFTDEELLERRVDLIRQYKDHPLIDEFHRAREFDWSQIEVPILSAGNWGGMGLHLRGNTRGYELAESSDKWLTMHEGTHWELFYAKYGLDLQKRFFGHFLKGEDTGWGDQPAVDLRVRRVDGSIEERAGSAWPLPETRWTPMYLDAANATMSSSPVESPASVSYLGLEGRTSFSYVASDQVELAGPVSAKLYVESSTSDADLFLVLRAFAPDGAEVVYRGSNDPHAPVAQGWLRVSQRTLDPDESRAFLPVHTHERVEALTPSEVYEVEVEIWPTSLILPVGYTLTLDVQGHDYVHPGLTQGPQMPFTGSGPFTHQDPDNRPADVYGGTVTLRTGGRYVSQLLLPVIPSANIGLQPSRSE